MLQLLLLGFCLLFSACTVLFLAKFWFALKNFQNISEEFDFSTVVKGFNEWVNADATNATSLQANINNLLVAPIANNLYNRFAGGLGGQMKGVNAGLRKADAEMGDMVLEGAISQLTQNPLISGLVMGQLDKYPNLKALASTFLPLIGSQKSLYPSSVTQGSGFSGARAPPLQT